MKKSILAIMIFVLMITLSACAKSEAEAGNGSGSKAKAVGGESYTQEDSLAEIAQQRDEELNGEQGMKSADASADFDLTAMGSDMVYATVYQMMMTPEQYEGKVVKMSGAYLPSFFEKTGQYYHCCLVKDAMQCCSQGIEFVWGDGSHVYPDDYPIEGETITVEGVFETYIEPGDSNRYCRLRDASLIVEEDK